MRTMQRPYQIAGTVLFLFSVFIGYESWTGLKFYTTLGPGPGFFPFWLSALMGLLAAVMLYQATFGQSQPMPDDFYASRVGYLRTLAVCVSIIGVVLLMENLGFRWTMAAFFAFLLVTLGRPNPLDALLVVVAGSIGTFKLFDNVLKVPLPARDYDAPVDALSGGLFGPLGIALLVAYVLFRFRLYRAVGLGKTAKQEG